MGKEEIKKLKRRYLIWLYKTTKETVDKIERKFTQLEIDKFILKDLRSQDRDKKLRKFINEFEVYIQNKEKEGLSLKYNGKNLNANYEFLTLKLKAIEKAGIKELGNKGWAEVKSLYEREMTERILKSTEHQ
jgi:ATP phosphoribosyltransferase